MSVESDLYEAMDPLVIRGEFTLRSGEVSKFYVDPALLSAARVRDLVAAAEAVLTELAVEWVRAQVAQTELAKVRRELTAIETVFEAAVSHAAEASDLADEYLRRAKLAEHTVKALRRNGSFK